MNALTKNLKLKGLISSTMPRSKAAGLILQVAVLITATCLAQPLSSHAKNSSTTGATQTTNPTLGAQIDPRTEKPAIGGGNTGPAGMRGDGFGQCPAFSHRHPTIAELNATLRAQGLPGVDPGEIDNKRYFTGGCFDDNEKPLIDLERRKLHKPAFHPDPDLNWL